MTVIAWFAGIFLIVTLSAQFASVALAAFHAVRNRKAASPRPDLPAVTILRPVCGLENNIEETLRSTFQIDWPRYEIVFCCASAADPVVPLVERLIAEHPDIPARLLTGDDRISINPKLNNLVKGWAAASHDWVLMADSNLILPTAYLAELFARWSAGTGLVCSPPVGGRPEGFGAEIECAFLNTYQARWQLAADAAGLGFAQGKTMLWRKDVLDAAGGIRALAAEPAEDAAATKIVRRAGLSVRLASGPYIQPLGRRSVSEMWRRQVRWARLRRVTFKVFFLPELLVGAFFPLVSATGLATAGVLPMATPMVIAVLWYGAEVLLSRSTRWHLSAATPLAWLVRDALLPALWVAAWMGNGFVWRGNAMNVEAEPRPGLIERLLARTDAGDSPALLSGALARWKTRRMRDRD